MPKATVYRFLQTMQSMGFVRQDIESERYGLTMKVFELGRPDHESVRVG